MGRKEDNIKRATEVMHLLPQIRNICIAAHIDHGKTTLSDNLIAGAGMMSEELAGKSRVLDFDDQESARGITINAASASMVHPVDGTDYLINLIDTPGHVDFGGDVTRAMRAVDGCFILACAVEGPMPQTRFVLRHALQRGLKAILVVNKIDRPAARPHWVVDQTLDLFIELGASDEQADFPVLYTQALAGRAGNEPDDLSDDLGPLFDAIVEHVPAPTVDVDGPPQLLVTTLQYSSYVGKIAVGRLSGGTLSPGQTVGHVNSAGEMVRSRVGEVFTFRNLKREPQDQVHAGSIIAVSGIDNVGIGDTITDADDPRPLPPIEVEQPTVRMTFSVNTSPFAGREGRFVTG